MGIKGWLTVGGLTLTAVLVLLGVRKDEDKRNEKIRKIIHDVDLKKEKECKKEEPKTVAELADDVNQAVEGMDLDGGEETAVEEPADILTEVKEMVQEGRHSTDIEWRFGEKIKDNKEVQDILEDLRKKEEAEREEYFRTEWIEEVEKAKASKNYSKLEDLFDQKYAGGPWHPSPASVFSDAKQDGVIDDSIYKGAEKYFGRLWCYSGD